MLRELDSLVFDLDGTLWDTCAACAIGWNNVVRRLGIQFRHVTPDDVRSVAGRSHAECIRAVFRGLQDNEIRELIAETQEEDNRMVSLLGGELYPGVDRGLEALSRRYPLYIVSNCQEGYVETFFETTGLGRYFRDYECWGRTGLVKADNLKSVILRNRLRSTVYVGDTQGDLVAARGAGVPFVHATYGFGRSDDYDARITKFLDLESLLMPH